jgi:5-methylcytosine-specific restriction endonuclease McrA
MPSQTYKEPRVCDCGYTTKFPSAWCVHKKSCKLVKCDKNELIEQMKQQLAAKDELLNEQREDLRMFEKLLAERFAELNDEVKQLRKRKKTTRINRSEPERREIAERQNWKCASDACKLAGKLEAYDLDHIIPLWKGGKDTDDNLQALCPACHRIKTDMERVERARLAEPVA